jgi:hypothetical protein
VCPIICDLACFLFAAPTARASRTMKLQGKINQGLENTHAAITCSRGTALVRDEFTPSGLQLSARTHQT